MKKLILIGIAIISICIISCQKDSPDKKNSVTIRGQEYELSAGGLRSYGYASDNYNLGIFLFTSEVIFVRNETDRYALPLKGEGQVIYFDVYASKNDALDNGVYNFTEIDTKQTMTVAHSSYVIDFKYGSGANWYEIVSGKINVTKNGDVYEITINCTDHEGRPVTGYYKGPLQFMTL